MLLGNNTRERVEGRALFPDLETATLRHVIGYLYTGRISLLAVEEGGDGEERALALVELLQAADRLLLPELKVGG
jgi:hypothetical protein